jgi:hypothetical protein
MNRLRRTFALLLVALAGQAAAHAQDPLPSWNDGPAKQAIVSFVHATTDPASPQFVPAAERIATFDQDGTLWVEHPMYTQVMYCLERVPALAKKNVELKIVEPFKTVLSGNRKALAKLSLKDIEKYAYGPAQGLPDTRVGTFPQTLYDKAKDSGWTVISMKNDWKRVFAFEQ